MTATDKSYYDDLSDASKKSLVLQVFYFCITLVRFFSTVDLKGGPFSAAQVSEFEAAPNWQEKVQLRRWDDAAKKVNFSVPRLEHYRSVVEMAFEQ